MDVSPSAPTTGASPRRGRPARDAASVAVTAEVGARIATRAASSRRRASPRPRPRGLSVRARDPREAGRPLAERGAPRRGRGTAGTAPPAAAAVDSCLLPPASCLKTQNTLLGSWMAHKKGFLPLGTCFILIPVGVSLK